MTEGGVACRDPPAGPLGPVAQVPMVKPHLSLPQPEPRVLQKHHSSHLATGNLTSYGNMS